jgi:TetR/AcrR family transcriptional regulator
VPRVSEATKAEHRRRLLESAASEFATKGLDGARVDQISLAAGLAKGTIYNYFDSKHHVFREVVAEWGRRTDEARADVPDDAPVEDQLLAVLEADMKVTGELEAFARTAFREVLRPTVEEAAQLLPSWDPVDEAVLRVIRRGQQAGELRNDRSAGELARIFTTLVNGLLFEHWLPDSDVGLDDIPRLVVDFYLDGARP